MPDMTGLLVSDAAEVIGVQAFYDRSPVPQNDPYVDVAPEVEEGFVG